MQFLIILSVLVLGTTAINQSFLETARSKIQKTIQECINEQKASQADFDTIIALNVPESHEGKCTLLCTHKKFDLQKADGTIDKEGAMTTFDILKDLDADFHQKWITVFNQCLNSAEGDDPCLRGAGLFTCIIREAKAAGIHDLIVE